MQTEIILAKYGELALKGLNRNQAAIEAAWKIHIYSSTIYHLYRTRNTRDGFGRCHGQHEKNLRDCSTLQGLCL